MNKCMLTCILCLIVTVLMFSAGCSKYADPQLVITSNITKVSEDQVTGNITYDVLLNVANTGENNAYKVGILAILSTPKDLPEYRFTSATIDVGDVVKGGQETLKRQMVLPATRANYDLIVSGAREPEVETKLTSVTSSAMG